MYKTPDIALAIALIVQGEELRQFERLKRDRYLFIFEETETLQGHVTDYWRQEITAPVQSVLAVARQLKKEIKQYAKEEAAASHE